MNYICGPLILYSLDKICMMDFLSDVFEFDIDLENDLVENGSLHLKLVELIGDQKKEVRSSGVKFVFDLESSDQLKEILKKYNFFLYRKIDNSSSYTSSYSSSESFKLWQDEQMQSLAITDIDGRVWQFDVHNTTQDCNV